jgi:WD40 repeat protein
MLNHLVYLQVEDPTLDRVFRGQKGAVTSLVFNSESKQLVSGSSSGSVMVWNFKPQLRSFRFAGHKVLYSKVRSSSHDSGKKPFALSCLVWSRGGGGGGSIAE